VPHAARADRSDLAPDRPDRGAQSKPRADIPAALAVQLLELVERRLQAREAFDDRPRHLLVRIENGRAKADSGILQLRKEAVDLGAVDVRGRIRMRKRRDSNLQQLDLATEAARIHRDGMMNFLNKVPGGCNT
jgi:hypothetical protein